MNTHEIETPRPMGPQRTFSIIMSVFNQEPWLERAIESLLKQDLKFQENVELILVNDGSQDRSLEICREYESRYPQNVVVIDQENQGLSASRNNGLKNSSGRFVNFMDPDDELEPNVLSSVLEFFTRFEESDLPFVSIPIEFSGTKSGPHPRYLTLPDESVVIDTLRSPDQFLLTSAATFYVRDVILQYRFDPRNIGAEDSEVNLEILLNHGFRWGYVNEANSKYLYWQHENPSKSMIGRNKGSRESLESIFRFVRRLASGTAPAPLQSALIYLIRPRIYGVTDEWFADNDDEAAFISQYLDVISLASIEARAGSQWLKSPADRLAFSTEFLRGTASLATVTGAVVSADGIPITEIAEIAVHVQRVNLTQTYVEVEVTFPDHFVDGLDLRIVGPDEITLRSVDISSDTTDFAPHVLARPATRIQRRRFRIPVEAADSRWHFAFSHPVIDNLVRATKVFNTGRSPFRGNDGSTKAISAKYWVRFTDAQEIWIRQTRSSVFLYNLRSTIRIALRKRAIIPARLFASPVKTNILINDRPHFGDDNGEALFRYIQAARPDLQKNTWLVLGSEAPSFAELAETGRIVRPGSFKHKRLFLNSKIVASSHLGHVFNSPWQGREQSLCADVIDQTFVWLQHGVTMNAVPRAVNRIASNVDGLVVAASHEVDFALRPGSLHSETTVLRSGFPRYDLLNDVAGQNNRMPKSILFLPTWRSWLTGPILPDGSHAPIENFEESDYFKQFQVLLESPEVLDLLERTDTQIEFLLHPGMAPYSDSFKRFSSRNIRIYDPGTVRYRDLLTNGSGLITDYSSVFFDFVYMKKPTLFYQPDQESFHRLHYGKGIFDYEKDAPGIVAKSADELLIHLRKMIEGSFQVSARDSELIEKIFLHHDQNNSQRTIDEILELDLRRRGMS